MPEQPSSDSGASSAPPVIKVLLVDDQRLTCLVLQRLFSTEHDIELHCCQVSGDATARAEELRPDLILQDLVMPDVDGWTMLGRYREHEATLRTPIVMLSANDDDGTRSRAFSSGAADYLVKMPAKGDLVACVRRLTAAVRATQASETTCIPASH